MKLRRRHRSGDRDKAVYEGPSWSKLQEAGGARSFVTLRNKRNGTELPIRVIGLYSIDGRTARLRGETALLHRIHVLRVKIPRFGNSSTTLIKE